ncbi:methanethiol S-methyltransferase [Sphingomonas sp.]|uniref:methanethiol S-methyltransferase n=1 Tax=Sphingomonas sp. TaxID=28214 RepID=UPI0017C58D42|nr:methanethiol S-methyltransferase [Sphingomonas sp.]MBA3512525.1 isoprenylcysteine carboxylmethyltransferase family protein [Sphingomonas sp.]
MSRAATLLFALFAYAVFFATFLYLICFVGNVPFAPLTVDRGPEAPVAIAVLINVALIASFGLQHSVMARQEFKQRWTQIVPPPAERSVYVLVASLMLIVLFLLWRPIEGMVWDARGTALELPLWLAFAAGWGIVLLSTFLLNHFELFGLQQAWFHMRGRQAEPQKLRQPLFYKWVAHPLYSGFFLAFWATPYMSYGHLLLALGMSAYMLIAIRYEERDLVGHYGDEYVRYRSGVGKLAPRLRRGGSSPPPGTAA